MIVKKFINKILSSNSYIVHTNDERNVWVIDPGESDQLLNWINENKKTVKGILLTHSHIDHIYGVNDICNEFQDLTIYASHFANEGMKSAKYNGSYYMGMSYVINHGNIDFVKENSTIELFKDKTIAKIISTPGHNNDCISFSIVNYLFTGDALIPGVKTHTKSKKSNKLIAIESISKILYNFTGDTIICPGHREMEILNLIEIPDLKMNCN
jgi:hydroxyacylglutathione hydrolase